MAVILSNVLIGSERTLFPRLSISLVFESGSVVILTPPPPNGVNVAGTATQAQVN